MSIFTKIVSGELPAYKVAEDEQHLAFLDINPNAKGHTLCIPKKETDKLFDLSQAEYIALMHFLRKVAFGLEKAVPCQRIGMTIIGLEVPHVHVHLIPLQSMADATFGKKEHFSSEEMQALAKNIAAHIAAE